MSCDTLTWLKTFKGYVEGPFAAVELAVASTGIRNSIQCFRMSEESEERAMVFRMLAVLGLERACSGCGGE
eukprot:12777226-Alexandrium_andersonii.AAC.1